MKGFLFGVAACLLLNAAFIVGWVSAHDEVSRECERQGGFYYGQKNYECRERKATSAKPESDQGA